MFPAYAGMDRFEGLTNSSPLGVPRIRGDGPSLEVIAPLNNSCSPHTRGWTVVEPSGAPIVLVFPAYAGMDRLV